MGVSIRALTPADVDPAADAVIRGDWGDRRRFFAFSAGHAESRPLVAVDPAGAIVGTGVGTVNGTVGWVGTIYVVPERRGEGIGGRLTAAVIGALERAGCRTLVLVATDQGRPLYEKLGFTIQTRYRILEHDALGDRETDPNVRPFSRDDVDQAARLDRIATGEDRRHLIAAFAGEAGSWALDGSHGELAAFLVRPPWGGGATIAPDAECAIRLLDHRRRAAEPGGRVRAGLIDDNATGLARLSEAGWRPVWTAVRMTRGDPLDWRPAWIWGQFNHAIG